MSSQAIRVNSAGLPETAILHILETEASVAEMRGFAMHHRSARHSLLFTSKGTLLHGNQAALDSYDRGSGAHLRHTSDWPRRHVHSDPCPCLECLMHDTVPAHHACKWTIATQQEHVLSDTEHCCLEICKYWMSCSINHKHQASGISMLTELESGVSNSL